ncbi:MAG TPA: ABC transporter ATP-binding protein [Candidatus Dojkabacteria bacterium]|nr:ABC transporter ATP-binding protein [Candidatus Dojkabacteria bacterium]
MKNILKILKISKPLHGLMLLIVFIVILATLFEIVTPLLSGRILDEVVRLAGAENREFGVLASLLGTSFAATVFYLLARSIGQRLGDELAGRLRKFLTEMFYDKTLRLPQAYFDSEISGKLVNQLNRGIITIQQFVNMSTNFIIPTLLQAIIVIAILFSYNLALGLLMIVILPIYMFITSISTRRWGTKEVEKNAIEDATRGRIQEVVTNIKLVKGFTSEIQEYALVSGNLVRINGIFRKQSIEFHLFDFLREFILNMILFGTSLIIFYNTLEGIITVGSVIVLMQLVERARASLFGMSFILTQVQAAESGSKEFFEILDLPNAENYRQKTKVERIKNPEIRFENVSFAYDVDRPVINDISLTLHKNEMVALVGPSGAGKSTIANLLLKLYNPTSGDILLNGKKYSKLGTRFIRENIALVFQENELFSSTIKENVAYGSTIDEKKIISALKKANAWTFVKQLPDGIDTEVGERGIKLSGGQRQRIQVARAIYKDAPILILDEATSSLDAKSENDVSEAINNLVKNRLVIVIAHRFSTIQNATKVVVLNGQKIEAVGSPKDLSTKPGIYSELLKYQIEGNKKLLKKFELY